MQTNYQSMSNFLKNDIQAEIKEGFYFVLSPSEIQKIIVDTITKNLHNNITNKEIILNQITTNFHQKINKILNNDQNICDCLEKFINQKLESQENAIKELEKYITFINDLEIFYTVDLNIKMLEKSKILYNLVATIFNENQAKFLSDEDTFLFTNELGDLIVRGYCFFNDVDLNDNIEKDFQKLEDNSSYSSDDLRMYVKEIAQYPLLTEEEEYLLGLRALKKDEEAINQLVKHNLKLVVYVAKKFVGNGLDVLDLIQEGNLGLMKSAQKFDVTKGYRFSTYAFNWIEQYIRRSLADQGQNIRQPVHFYEKMKRFKRIQNELTISLNREPTIEELKAKTGYSEKIIKDLLYFNRETVSYNIEIGEDGSELEMFLKDENSNTEESVLKNVSSLEIRNALNNVGLTPKELDVIMLRNGFVDDNAWTLEKISQKYGVTRERIRQIETKALGKIKRNRQIKNMFPEYYKTKSNSLFALLETKSKEAIDEALTKLYPEELAILNECFDNEYNLKNDAEDNIILKKDIIPALKKLINNPNWKRKKPQWLKKSTKSGDNKTNLTSLYELVAAPKEEVDNILSKLYPEEYFLIIKRFGRDLCTLNNDFSPFEYDLLYNFIYKTLKRFLKNPNMHHYLPNWVIDLRKNDIFLNKSIEFLQENNFTAEEIAQIFPNANLVTSDFKRKRVLS